MTPIELALKELASRVIELGFDGIKKSFEDNDFVDNRLIDFGDKKDNFDFDELENNIKKRLELHRLEKINKESYEFAAQIIARRANYGQQLVADGRKKKKWKKGKGSNGEGRRK